MKLKLHLFFIGLICAFSSRCQIKITTSSENDPDLAKFLMDQGEITSKNKGIIFSDTLISKSQFVIFKFGLKELHAPKYLYLLNASGDRIYIKNYACISVMQSILSNSDFIDLNESEKLKVLMLTIDFLNERAEKLSQWE